jgi:hypothetical protein
MKLYLQYHGTVSHYTHRHIYQFTAGYNIGIGAEHRALHLCTAGNVSVLIWNGAAEHRNSALNVRAVG